MMSRVGAEGRASLDRDRFADKLAKLSPKRRIIRVCRIDLDVVDLPLGVDEVVSRCANRLLQVQDIGGLRLVALPDILVVRWAGKDAVGEHALNVKWLRPGHVDALSGWRRSRQHGV